MNRLLLALLAVATLSACNSSLSSAIGQIGLGAGSAVPWPVPDANADTTTTTGLKYSILAPGPANAKVATRGQTVFVNYAGWLTNGQPFDDSFKTGKPFSFTLGAGRVIAGWDEGVAGMKVGERRKLVVPGALAYGSAGTTGIPPNATLIFEVELLSIQP